VRAVTMPSRSVLFSQVHPPPLRRAMAAWAGLRTLSGRGSTISTAAASGAVSGQSRHAAPRSDTDAAGVVASGSERRKSGPQAAPAGMSSLGPSFH